MQTFEHTAINDEKFTLSPRRKYLKFEACGEPGSTTTERDSLSSNLKPHVSPAPRKNKSLWVGGQKPRLPKPR